MIPLLFININDDHSGHVSAEKWLFIEWSLYGHQGWDNKQIWDQSSQETYELL